MKILICLKCRKLHIVDDTDVLNECSNPFCDTLFDGIEEEVTVNLLKELVE